jgi:hypothetical protein
MGWACIKLGRNTYFLCFVSMYPSERYVATGPHTTSLAPTKTGINKTIILLVVLRGSETWSLTLTEEYRRRVYENSVLRRIFGWRRDELTEYGESCIMMSFAICTLHQVLA